MGGSCAPKYYSQGGELNGLAIDENLLSRIELLSAEFRRAIEKAKASGEFKQAPFNNFPHACCGDASLLLAEYLLENDIDAYCVGGTFYDRSPEGLWSHSWVVVNGLIVVDITADQFRAALPPLRNSTAVYCGPEDAFHNLFKYDWGPMQERICHFDEPARSRLSELYSTIMRFLG